MPQYFLEQAGLDISQDFKGDEGFSSNHDATIKLVEAGTYEVGAVNEQVWLDRVSEGAVDTTKVAVIWRTPPYYDYHWVISPVVDERYGEGFTEKVQAALKALDPAVPEQKKFSICLGPSGLLPPPTPTTPRSKRWAAKLAKSSSGSASRSAAGPGLSPILQLEGVSCQFGAVAALVDCSLSIGAGERVALIGPSVSVRVRCSAC